MKFINQSSEDKGIHGSHIRMRPANHPVMPLVNAQAKVPSAEEELVSPG
jgi:hypothetical protein